MWFPQWNCRELCHIWIKIQTWDHYQFQRIPNPLRPSCLRDLDGHRPISSGSCHYTAEIVAWFSSSPTTGTPAFKIKKPNITYTRKKLLRKYLIKKQKPTMTYFLIIGALQGVIIWKCLEIGTTAKNTIIKKNTGFQTTHQQNPKKSVTTCFQFSPQNTCCCLDWLAARGKNWGENLCPQHLLSG